MPSFWDRIFRRSTADAARRHEDESHMSPAERAIVEGNIEDVAADEAAEEHLGGFDPGELVEDDEPPRI